MVVPMASEISTAAITEDLIGRANLAMINTLNVAARAIYQRSQKRVPRSQDHQVRPGDPEYPEEPLADTGRVVEATPEDHVAQVQYDSPYATAQEVGRMTYQSRSGKEVEWQAMNYTTPGTGAHYLSESAKEILGQIPEELAIQGRMALGEYPGPVVSKSEVQSLGRRELMKPPPTGEIAAFGRVEGERAAIVPETSLLKPAPPTLQ